MSDQGMLLLARLKGQECLRDRDGDICIRPMLFDDDGIRVVQMRPDPRDFRPRIDAEAFLNALPMPQEKGAL